MGATVAGLRRGKLQAYGEEEKYTDTTEEQAAVVAPSAGVGSLGWGPTTDSVATLE